jgi:hypothetical protein
MPIIDIEFVADADDAICGVPAQRWADALGQALATPAGRTWVRLRRLDAQLYAENEAPVAADEHPVFVQLLLARWPEEPAWSQQMTALTEAVSAISGRPADRVHVQLAPPAAGRQAFGGHWVK